MATRYKCATVAPLLLPAPALPHSIIFCEATAIYGVIVAIILQTKIEPVTLGQDQVYQAKALYSGYSILGAGLTCGFANMACG
jgi:V-type H+-transporting ATPase 21kDa proteolipid subunit